MLVHIQRDEEIRTVIAGWVPSLRSLLQLIWYRLNSEIVDCKLKIVTFDS